MLRTKTRLVILVAAIASAALLLLRLQQRASPPHADRQHGPVPSAEAAGTATETASEASRPAAPTAISGTVSGKYGPIVAVLVVARVDGEIVAETTTDADGRYRLEVPACASLDLEVRPAPETELAPARRTLVLGAGEEDTEDFQLGKGGSASGVVEGGSAFPPDVIAIRVEDYPTGDDPPSVGALEAAPKVSPLTTGVSGSGARLRTGFAFRGLDLGATYRLAVLDREWAIARPVLFRAGDDKISAPLEHVLRIFVEVTDVETRKPVPVFQVTLANQAGAVLDTFEGHDGRVSRCRPYPEWTTSSNDGGSVGGPHVWNTWELRISAEGYVETTCSAHGGQVVLQRVRAPNVLLNVSYDDGTAYDGEIDARFEALEDPDTLLDVALRREEPGRFRAALPPGKWRLHLKRPSAFQDVVQVADIEVPEKGTVDVLLQYRRGGTVTFKAAGLIDLERDAEYGRESLCTHAGTYEDVPPGTYHVMDGDKETATFEVRPGSTQLVQVPPRHPQGGG